MWNSSQGGPGVTASAGDTVFQGNKVCSTEAEVKLAYAENNDSPLSLISPFLYKWLQQICTVWSVQITLFWLVRMEPLWLVGKDANEDIIAQPQLAGAGIQPIS